MPKYFDVCFEDRQLLVVNKRAAVATMGVTAEKPSLLVAAKQYLAGDQDVATCFAAVTGRLDFPVSGLVVFAKDPVVADHLRRQQEDGSIRKVYHALVSGHVDPPSGQLTGWLLKSKRHRRVSIAPEGTHSAQIAKLNYRLLVGDESVSRLSIELLTGRKHQIRAQLSHMGHPILGDRKYGSTDLLPEGIALVCKRISLVHPASGQRVKWVVDDPPAWAGLAVGAKRS